MEFKEIFISMAVSFVCIVAIMSWMGGLNTAYSSNIGSTFNNSLGRVQGILNNSLVSTGTALGANVQAEEGAGEADQQQSLIKKSLATIGIVGDLITLPQTLFSEAASAIGIPATYTNIATILFVIIFAITIAYLLLLGVKNLIS